MQQKSSVVFNYITPAMDAELQFLVNDACRGQHTAYSAAATAVRMGTAAPTGINASISTVTQTILTNSKFKLEVPMKFTGRLNQILNFLFNGEYFCGVIGITTIEEIAKMVVLLLNNKALICWRSVATKAWA